MNPLAKAIEAYKGHVNRALEAARYNPMVKSRVTRELIREQAAQSDVHNLLAAIVAGLKDGSEDPALRPFCDMAREEVEAAMIRISNRHPNRKAA